MFRVERFFGVVPCVSEFFCAGWCKGFGAWVFELSGFSSLFRFRAHFLHKGFIHLSSIGVLIFRVL